MPTKIGWTQETLNPWVGCTKIRAGCKNDYAERLAKRLKAMGKPAYQDVVDEHGWTGKICWQEGQLEKPLHWRKPRMIFWGSMTDIFHEDVPIVWRSALWNIIERTPQHNHQILTKRIDFARQWYASYGVPENLWPGLSISNQKDADEMIRKLLQIPAKVRFVSVEPLLEEIDIYDALIPVHLPDGSLTNAEYNEQYLDWLIIGCERLAGNKAGRFCDDEVRWWAAAKSLVEQAQATGVPVFFKQGPINGKVSENPQDWPEWARVQEWPRTCQ